MATPHNSTKSSKSIKLDEKNKRELDRQLDMLEMRIEELKVQYEQYFIDVLPLAPNALQKEVRAFIRKLLKAPFKTAAIRFRLRALIQKYQSYHTYWERTLKERESGTYRKDIFKAEMREKLADEAVKANNPAERNMKDLFDRYAAALRSVGGTISPQAYQAFKKTLVEKGKKVREQTGAKKLSYKIVVRDGKVVVKASPK